MYINAINIYDHFQLKSIRSLRKSLRILYYYYIYYKILFFKGLLTKLFESALSGHNLNIT